MYFASVSTGRLKTAKMFADSQNGTNHSQFDKMSFRLPLEALFSSDQVLPSDFSIVCEGTETRPEPVTGHFNTTALTYSARRVFRLLLEDPLCRTLKVTHGHLALPFLESRHAPITEENVQDICLFAIELEMISVLKAASDSDAFKSMDADKKDEIMAMAKSHGLETECRKACG